MLYIQKTHIVHHLYPILPYENMATNNSLHPNFVVSNSLGLKGGDFFLNVVTKKVMVYVVSTNKNLPLWQIVP
jgi:hypothetical protein